MTTFNFAKTYANKSDATRAARKAGIEAPVAFQTEDGRFGIVEPKAPEKGTKGAKMEAARELMRTTGATAAEIAALNDWAAHTVTNFLCTLRTVEMLKVEKVRNEAKAWVYKIAA